MFFAQQLPVLLLITYKIYNILVDLTRLEDLQIYDIQQKAKYKVKNLRKLSKRKGIFSKDINYYKYNKNLKICFQSIEEIEIIKKNFNMHRQTQKTSWEYQRVPTEMEQNQK